MTTSDVNEANPDSEWIGGGEEDQISDPIINEDNYVTLDEGDESQVLAGQEAAEPNEVPHL